MSDNPFILGLMDLPESPDLGIRYLSGVFRHTTNSYKFYWFLAILEAVKNGLDTLSVNLLTAEMLAQAWYPVHSFKLHFGSQDQLGRLVSQLKEQRELPLKSDRLEVRNAALTQVIRNKQFAQDFHKLQRFVPQRFLSPWFSAELHGLADHQRDKMIQHLAEKHWEQPQAPLYRFVEHPLSEQVIEIHPTWMTYLQANFRIIRDFVLWNLVEFLRQKNPNVPNLPEKLFPPLHREMSMANKYWRFVLDQDLDLRCPYSAQLIPNRGFSLDHFIPWSFIGHDQLWNLVPIPKAINSAKSDRLPDLDYYLQAFIVLQFQGLKIFLKKSEGKNKAYLEDYITLFRCDIETLSHIKEEVFINKLKDTIIPLEQIATNTGFIRGWFYQAL